MDRAEQAGLGVAVAGHVLVFGALSLGLIAAPKPLLPPTPAVDIQIIDAVALKDQAPNPAPAPPAPPAPSVAPEVGPPTEVPPPPEPVAALERDPMPVPSPPAPARKVAVQPKPRPAAKPLLPRRVAAQPAPAKPNLKLALAAPSSPTGPVAPPRGARLGSDFLKGIADRPTASSAPTPRAPLGALATASIGRLVREQLKPHWKAPTGADAQLLRTELSISLSRDGQVTDVHVIRTTGQTDSNRGQVRLHQEAAMKAVRLAAPFSLPAELYDAWKLLEPVGFDKRLG